MKRLIAGCMTGTSCDGLDIALVAIHGFGLGMRAEIQQSVQRPLGEVGSRLRTFAAGAALTAAEICALQSDFVALHRELLTELPLRPELLVVHGQTVHHAPPASWQMLDLSQLAHATDLPVLGDLRSADLARGGQGAPITPLADLILFGRDLQADRAVVNLGGFCNVTILPAAGDPERIAGADYCACNQLLDHLARRRLGRAFDAEGRAAAAGRPVDAIVQAIRQELDRQRLAGRSLGSGDELCEQVDGLLGDLPASDALASAVAAIGASIGSALADLALGDVLLAGGGALHPGLVATIARQLDCPVRPSSSCGVAVQEREAAAMAVLGALSSDGVPITLPQVTGVPAPAPLAGTLVRPQRGSPTLPPVVAPAASTRADDGLPLDRSAVLSEQRHPGTLDLHRLSVAACLERIVQVDAAILPALREALPALTAFVHAVAPGFRRGGRLVYVGAGTSGRLGVLDASEAPPTFQVPPDRIIGIIAGGDGALRKSSEGREDEEEGAVAELRALDLGPDDAVLGIAAGGTTPYPRGAVSWAASLSAAPVTGFLSCSPVAAPPGCQYPICIATGPEALTGSTRMKAGTATKMALNLISTTLMVQAGRVYENLMVDLRASNAKLRDRAARIIGTVTGVDRAAAFDLLDQADGEVKTAIAMLRLACSATEARVQLEGVGGRLADLDHSPR